MKISAYHIKLRGTLYHLLLVILILFSYFTFSELYFPLLNSDMAVTVLMTPGFTIPGDLYFWGQDRAGSLIPMIAQVLCYTYHFPPAMAVSIVHFALLIAGFFALASLFKDFSLKFALALIWFFPSWHFLDHLLILYGVQMSLVAISVYFLNRLSQTYSTFAKLFWITLSSLSLVTAVWVSDLAIISVLLFVFAVLSGYWKKEGKIKSALQNRSLVLMGLGVFIFWMIIGAIFIYYAKSRAFHIEEYNQNVVSSPGEIGQTLMIIIQSVKEGLFFQSGHLVESIYWWAMILGLPVIFFLTDKKRDPSLPFTQQRWLVFFFLNGFITLLFVVLSHWVFLNGAGRRYFVVVYISIWIAILLFLQSNGSKKRSLRLIILYLVILPGVVSSFNKFFFPKRIPPRMEVLSELKSLGSVGIIGEYWNAYLTAVVDPGKIKATPHDKDQVRNQYAVEEVFRQSQIYLIKDGWLDHFPDTIRQFGHLLQKDGEMIHLADCYLCRYKQMKLFMEFNCTEMKSQGVTEYDAETASGRSVRTGKGFDYSRHFIYGPFITLAPGKIAVKFRLNCDDNLSTSKLAYLDVSGDFGKTTLASLTIRPADFGRANGYQEFELPVELTKQYEGMEFRILYLGQPTIHFDKVSVRGY